MARGVMAIRAGSPALGFVAVAAFVALGQTSPFGPRKRELPRGANYGTMYMSDGDKYEGWVHLTPGRRLRFFDKTSKKAVHYSLRQLRELKVRVVASRVEKEWRFKAGGNDLKVYTGKQYARKDLAATVVMKNGETKDLEIALGMRVYLVPDKGKRKRFILQPYMRGPQGSELKDVVHISRIVFHKPGQAPDKKADKPSPRERAKDSPAPKCDAEKSAQGDAKTSKSGD